ncbi:hypothetical protein L9Z73_27665, partial [Pseudomonas sp. TNT11]|nr:hypothetical protein [Pseudomonas emilianonis]
PQFVNPQAPLLTQYLILGATMISVDMIVMAGYTGLASKVLRLAARDDMVRSDVRLLRGLSVVLLAGLVLINLAVLFVLPWDSASGVWAASGLLVIWLSLYLQQRVSFVFGLLLQLLGGASFLLAVPELLGPLTQEGLRPLGHSALSIWWTCSTTRINS